MDETVLKLISLLFFAGYLCGSIPFGLILSKIAGHGDIRNIGSGNIGATNVLRTGNKKLAILTLLLDVGKAAIPIYVFYHFAPPQESYAYPEPFFRTIALTLGLGAILGHCFPIWLKFKGGKGVATALGVFLAAVPYTGLVACATWLLAAFLFKISSLSALIAVAIAPIITFFIYGKISAFACALISMLVWVKHKENIKRLLNGNEPSIGSEKK